MSDLLEQATRALRETTSEPNPKSGLTRARILESAESRYTPAPRSRGLLRWAVITVAALGTSTALAHFTQEYWPEIKKVFAPEAEQHSAAEQAKRKPKKAQPAAREEVQLQAAGAAAPAEAVVAPAEPQPTLAEADAAKPAPAPSAPQPQPKRSNKPRPKLTPREPSAPKATESKPSPEAVATAPDQAQAPERLAAAAPKPPAESAELALFRRAQRLHLAKDAGALAAWDDYLRVAGKGALVPEAKYNRALCLIRLGRKAEAKRALAPFAAGEYGTYRSAEAKSLIEALDRED